MSNHYQLPEGWTWRRVVTERTKWKTSERLYPVADVPGICVAWGRPMDGDGNLQTVDE